MIHEFRGFRISHHMLQAIRDYIEKGWEPGGFLTAVICNDLKEAVCAADGDNMRNIPAFVDYFYNVAPSSCWGSPEKMAAWLAHFAEPTRGEARPLPTLIEVAREAGREAREQAADSMRPIEPEGK